MSLTAALIVRDEAEHLDACLASLDLLVDEVVVVDTGSTDGSVSVARRHGAIVAHQDWQSDFSIPRNRSLELASSDWVLYIDADERVRCPDPTAVRDRLSTGDHDIALRVPLIPRVGWTPYHEMRMWRNRPDIRFVGSIHESALPAIERVASTTGLRVGVLDGLTIEHLGYEHDHDRKHERNEPLLEQALATQPDRLFLYDHLARIYESRDEDDRARAMWRAGIDVSRTTAPDHAEARILWIDLIIHVVTREDPEAELPALLDEAAARFPDDPALEFAMASHELATGCAADATCRFERLTHWSRDEFGETLMSYDGRIFGEWSWHALGLCHFSLGDYDDAAAAFRRAESADPTNVAYRTRRRLAEARSASRISSR